MKGASLKWIKEAGFAANRARRFSRVCRRLVGVTNSLVSVGSGLSWTLRRSQAEDLDFNSVGDKELMAEHKIKLSMALSVMQECFKPMIDPRTNLDLVANVLYNRGTHFEKWLIWMDCL